jgi:hypothetical protein
MIIPKNAIETTHFHTWMGEDGICRTVVKDCDEVTIEAAKANTAAVNSLFVDRKFPILIDSRNVNYISREAREHFSTKGRETVTNAFGILVDSPLSRIIGNFFMGINKPPVPTRLFKNEASAVKWLKTFVIND